MFFYRKDQKRIKAIWVIHDPKTNLLVRHVQEMSNYGGEREIAMTLHYCPSQRTRQHSGYTPTMIHS